MNTALIIGICGLMLEAMFLTNGAYSVAQAAQDQPPAVIMQEMVEYPDQEENTQEAEPEQVKQPVPYKIGAGVEQQQLIQYVWEKTHEPRLIYTIEAESGWIWDRVGIAANYDGTRDYLLCQLNSYWHKEFLASSEAQDPYKVADYCIAVWGDASIKGKLTTTFYGYNNINKVKDRFEWR